MELEGSTYVSVGGFLCDEVCVVQIAEDGSGPGFADALGVFLATHESGDVIALGYEEIKNVPADEARADDEDGLSCHF